MTSSVEVLAVGNELLDGSTQDTNTHWLCQQVTALGGRVERAAMVRDRVEAIAAEIEGARVRGAALLLVTGGLGPTADDMTLAGLAAAAGRPLVEHAGARAMVARRYQELHAAGRLASPELSPQRLKMACLPEGAEPIENPVGAAPAVMLRLGQTTVVCLPGVPAELKGIFAGPLQPLLASVLGWGSSVEREVLVRLNDESAMAEALHEVANLFPDVYIKSHARDFERGPGIRVTFSSRSADPEAARQRINAAIHALSLRLPLSDSEP